MVSGDISGHHDLGGAAGIQNVEATKPPTIHWTAPITESDLVQMSAVPRSRDPAVGELPCPFGPVSCRGSESVLPASGPPDS